MAPRKPTRRKPTRRDPTRRGPPRGGPTPGEPPARERTRDLSQLAALVIDPVLRRRAGLGMAVAARWPDIVGPALAGATVPGRIRWGRRPAPGERGAPGTLVVLCSGAAALRVQHEADQIVERVNAAFGYDAIARIRVEQRPAGEVASGEPHRAAVEGMPHSRSREATPAERASAAAMMRPIAHERLRGALARLAERVVVARSAPSPASTSHSSTSPSNFHDHTITSTRTQTRIHTRAPRAAGDGTDGADDQFTEHDA